MLLARYCTALLATSECLRYNVPAVPAAYAGALRAACVRAMAMATPRASLASVSRATTRRRTFSCSQTPSTPLPA
eukprot:scaffold4543_cov126-Isochrysis_galbana.AAC.8